VEDQVALRDEVSSAQKNKPSKRAFVGIVTSDKMDKTIVVSVSTKKMHRLYKKYVTRVKKCKAHDEKNDARTGDKVRIVECRPLSREKCWRLVEILERAK
jgi:small subunit ribosomal protein S17